MGEGRKTIGSIGQIESKDEVGKVSVACLAERAALGAEVRLLTWSRTPNSGRRNVMPNSSRDRHDVGWRRGRRI